MLTQALRSVMFQAVINWGPRAQLLQLSHETPKTIPNVGAWVVHFISSNIWKHMLLAITNPKCSSLLSQSIKYMTQQGSTNFVILQSRIVEPGLHDGVSLENMENMENMKYIEKIQSILFVNRIKLKTVSRHFAPRQNVLKSNYALLS